MSPNGDEIIGISGGQCQSYRQRARIAQNPPLYNIAGTHMSLIAQGGLYANLAVLQFHHPANVALPSTRAAC